VIFYIFDLSIAKITGIENYAGNARPRLNWRNLSVGKPDKSQNVLGSTMNLYARITSYFYLSKVTRVILKALKKYGFSSFTLILVFVPKASR